MNRYIVFINTQYEENVKYITSTKKEYAEKMVKKLKMNNHPEAYFIVGKK